MTLTWASYGKNLYHCFRPQESSRYERRTLCGRFAIPGDIPHPLHLRVNKGHWMPIPGKTCWTCYYSYCQEKANGDFV